MKASYTVVVVFLLGVLGALALISSRRLRALDEVRSALAIKGARFDIFCAEQKNYLSIVVGHLQSHRPSELDVAEFDDVFVVQAGKRDLILCLGGATWDHDRAEACSARRDAPCLVAVATQTMGLLDAAVGSPPSR